MRDGDASSVQTSRFVSSHPCTARTKASGNQPCCPLGTTTRQVSSNSAVRPSVSSAAGRQPPLVVPARTLVVVGATRWGQRQAAEQSIARGRAWTSIRTRLGCADNAWMVVAAMATRELLLVEWPGKPMIVFFLKVTGRGESPPPEFHSFIGPELAQQIVQKGVTTLFVWCLHYGIK